MASITAQMFAKFGNTPAAAKLAAFGFQPVDQGNGHFLFERPIRPGSKYTVAITTRDASAVWTLSDSAVIGLYTSEHGDPLWEHEAGSVRTLLAQLARNPEPWMDAVIHHAHTRRKISAVIDVGAKDPDSEDEVVISVHVEGGAPMMVVGIVHHAENVSEYPFQVDVDDVMRRAGEVFAAMGLTSIHCPACGQHLSVDTDDDDKIECGGIGNGTCDASNDEEAGTALFKAIAAAYVAAVEEATQK